MQVGDPGGAGAVLELAAGGRSPPCGEVVVCGRSILRAVALGKRTFAGDFSRSGGHAPLKEF